MQKRRKLRRRTSRPTSVEILRPALLRILTRTGLCTSSDEVADAWSLSPSDPIFTSSWTISASAHTEIHAGHAAYKFQPCLLVKTRFFSRKCEMVPLEI